MVKPTPNVNKMVTWTLVVNKMVKPTPVVFK
jgi:hypothetical protein